MTPRRGLGVQTREFFEGCTATHGDLRPSGNTTHPPIRSSPGWKTQCIQGDREGPGQAPAPCAWTSPLGPLTRDQEESSNPA